MTQEKKKPYQAAYREKTYVQFQAFVRPELKAEIDEIKRQMKWSKLDFLHYAVAAFKSGFRIDFPKSTRGRRKEKTNEHEGS